ncbi:MULTISPECIES: thioesterase family protein [Rhizobium]|uniref:Bifunctional 3-hydroxyacyl-CoA dehydrogenase/thioesterase n=2 Tax=Rhizobium TaxID=379 RepID=K0Q4E9_9HYPH|nr:MULTISPECIES: thioesterase family protein [Rhizobium]KWV43457.1 3-hydroxyacyl-CoA dehydrogenase [Rhizobium altiplani]CCM79995.1 Bifunctional 3-hydroxyacyl-CoA dehydrogenase/thioesterase [Rhizobium mesoamericanum STM3625]
MNRILNREAGKPIGLWNGRVLPEWLDYNSHMTEHRYLQVFGESSDALYKEIGVDFEHAEKGAYYTLETHIKHRAEAKVGTELWSETEVLGYDEKRLHIYHLLFDTHGKLLATGEHLSIHVRASSAEPASQDMIEKIRCLFEAQRSLPVPEGTGSVLRRPLVFNRTR